LQSRALQIYSKRTNPKPTSAPYDICGEKVDKNDLKCGIQAIGITGKKIN